MHGFVFQHQLRGKKLLGDRAEAIRPIRIKIGEGEELRGSGVSPQLMTGR